MPMDNRFLRPMSGGQVRIIYLLTDDDEYLTTEDDLFIIL